MSESDLEAWWGGGVTRGELCRVDACAPPNGHRQVTKQCML
jgi:hypothetical protein